jgi:hypothetical protein
MKLRPRIKKQRGGTPYEGETTVHVFDTLSACNPRDDTCKATAKKRGRWMVMDDWLDYGLARFRTLKAAEADLAAHGYRFVDGKGWTTRR